MAIFHVIQAWPVNPLILLLHYSETEPFGVTDMGLTGWTPFPSPNQCQSTEWNKYLSVTTLQYYAYYHCSASQTF